MIEDCLQPGITDSCTLDFAVIACVCLLTVYTSADYLNTTLHSFGGGFGVCEASTSAASVDVTVTAS